jgi:hypothetical protein
MGIRVEHQLGHAGRGAGVDRLLQAELVERGADGLRTDDRDGLEAPRGHGEDRGRLARGDDARLQVVGRHAQLLDIKKS